MGEKKNLQSKKQKLTTGIRKKATINAIRIYPSSGCFISKSLPIKWVPESKRAGAIGQQKMDRPNPEFSSTP